MSKSERVACYIRVSSQEQKIHGLSLDAQRDKLKDYAASHGLKIVGWYEDEGVSGRRVIRKRPELQRMLLDAQAGMFDRILFIKLDRFFRSVAEYHECMKQLSPVIWTATEEKYDLSTANGRAFVNMKLTIAELEADQTGERIKLVHDYMIKNGQAITGDASITFAFHVAKVDGVKRVIHNQDTEDMVKEYIHLVLMYQSLRKAFTEVYYKYGTTYTYSAFRNMLGDTKLYGTYRNNDHYCEPYVTKAEWEKLQEIRSQNVKHAPTGVVYLFTGIMHCPKCGRVLVSRNTIRPSGKQYIYYRCNNRSLNRSCDFSPQIKEEAIEEYLLESFDQLVVEHITSIEVAEAREMEMDTDGQIRTIKEEMARLNTMFQKNRITEAEYDREYLTLEASLKAVKSRIEPISSKDLSIYKDILKDGWKGLYKALTRENRRAFWRKYIKEIKVDENGHITGLIFF